LRRTGSSGIATTLIGRNAELGSIEAFLVQVRDGPAALVLSGEPGIGKTVLWEAGVNQAAGLGRVLSCRGVEAEASLAFAGLSELLAGELDGVTPTLAPPRRRALEVALLLAEPEGQAPDAHAIGLALLDVLRALAEHRPVVVAVDDLQWLDPSSAAVLQIALRRVRDERIGFLTTVRKAPDVAVPFDLERAFPQEYLSGLSLAPLRPDELRLMLEERLGLALTRPELARVQEATAGNPFFALEIGRELVRTSERPSAGRGLRLPESLTEFLGKRLARLPPDASDVLLLAAAAGRPTVETVASAHGDERTVREALGLAAREGVVSLDGTHVRFTHPMLASVCYEKAPPWDRRAAHRVLAGAVADAEERARHRALAADGADASVARELDEASQLAAGRGASATAAELAEFAAALTPPDDASAGRRRRLQAARLRLLSGEGERARTILEALLAEVPHGVERADVLFLLAGHGLTVTPTLPEATELFQTALSEAEGDDARGARILARLATNRSLGGDVLAGLVDARAALEKAEQVGDPILLASAIAGVALLEEVALDITPGLLERGVAIEESLAQPLPFFDSPTIWLGWHLLFWDEPDRAREVLEGAAAKALEHGDELSYAFAENRLTVVDCYAGRWPQALERAALVRELSEQGQWGSARGWALLGESLVLAYLGHVERARAAAEEALRLFESARSVFLSLLEQAVLGHIELALGNLDSAGGYLGELPRRLLDGGWCHPPASVWPDAIEALLGLGETEQARLYVEEYEPLAERSSRRSRAEAARCRGLLAASEGDLEGAFAAFDRSLREQEGLAYPFDRARTLLALGGVRRKAKQKRLARETLEQALAAFDELGARLWAEKARAELRRISGRRPASAELTETEQRVAMLAAEGRSNKAIAAALFVSTHTVDRHLAHIYAKLDVHSRRDLAERLAIPPRDEVKRAEKAAKE
jgi:DNA-binding CsgD family transcriptional regulator